MPETNFIMLHNFKYLPTFCSRVIKRINKGIFAGDISMELDNFQVIRCVRFAIIRQLPFKANKCIKLLFKNLKRTDTYLLLLINISKKKEDKN